MRQMVRASRSIALVAVFAAYLLSFFHRFAPAGIVPETASTLYLLCWAMLLVLPAQPPHVTLPLFLVMGASNAAFVLTWACAKEVNPPALSGISTALTNMGGFLGGALLQPLVGKTLDYLGGPVVTEAGVRLYLPETMTAALTLLAAAAAIGWLAGWRITETGARQWTDPSRAIK